MSIKSASNSWTTGWLKCVKGLAHSSVDWITFGESLHICNMFMEFSNFKLKKAAIKHLDHLFLSLLYHFKTIDPLPWCTSISCEYLSGGPLKRKLHYGLVGFCIVYTHVVACCYAGHTVMKRKWRYQLWPWCGTLLFSSHNDDVDDSKEMGGRVYQAWPWHATKHILPAPCVHWICVYCTGSTKLKGVYRTYFLIPDLGLQHVATQPVWCVVSTGATSKFISKYVCKSIMQSCFWTLPNYVSRINPPGRN